MQGEVLGVRVQREEKRRQGAQKKQNESNALDELQLTAPKKTFSEEPVIVCSGIPHIRKPFTQIRLVKNVLFLLQHLSRSMVTATETFK